MLKVDSSNWIMYKTRLIWALEGKWLSSYLTRTNPHPSNPQDGKDASWSPTATEQILINQYSDKAAKWEKDNGYIKSLIGPTLPDSLLMKVFREVTAKGIWDFLVTEFEGRSHIVVLELRRKLQSQRCQEKADLHAHFDHMFALREELATLGQSIDDSEFSAILLTSLSMAYDQSMLINICSEWILENNAWAQRWDRSL